MKQKASICTMCILILDQIIKSLITNNLELTDTVKVTDFFNLVFVRNYGAAWGILNGSRLLLIIVGIVTIFLLYTLFTNKPNENNFESIAIGFLTGGILGNLVDRIFRGYVVDYLSVKIVNYDFPVFNLADSCIVIGVIILILSMLGSEKYDNSRSKQHEA